MDTFTELAAYETITGEKVVMVFDETGYQVVTDERKDPSRSFVGYLHINENSAESITEAVRDQLVRYLYKHPDHLPGVGATPQQRYFRGLCQEDMECIGNDGKRAFYN